MTKIVYFLPMHRVVFAVYPGFELLDVSGPSAAFNSANRELEADGKPRFYKINLVSGQGGSVISSSGIVVDTSCLDLHGTDVIDTLLIAGAEREPLLRAMADPALRKVLPPTIGKAKRYGSVCSGAFLLAAVGLLDGHRVTTHWDASKPLAEAFPSLRVDSDALFVVDGRLWTSAGVTTGIDMALAPRLRVRLQSGSCFTHGVLATNLNSARCCKRRGKLTARLPI
jgi:transcriptional regulator GlxA family with amidase domain